ncbi:hypothetical protein NQ318_021211 [Aromia moschata]|uniref:Uncharacterized protein n=1 Tax=Aromia moschata TaxID=1265417 RepID=A0AAV8X1W7_9CUCU|nr:hypothetical protein NQ318_021211 [Aromia moschata]
MVPTRNYKSEYQTPQNTNAQSQGYQDNYPDYQQQNWGQHNNWGSSSLRTRPSETTSDSKPKINIISDIKLPPVFNGPSDKKINIISDIKIEPKIEDFEESMSVKLEIKNEVKSEIKVEDDVKTVDNPLAKLTPLMPLKDSKRTAESLMIGQMELLGAPHTRLHRKLCQMEILFCIIREHSFR